MTRTDSGDSGDGRTVLVVGLGLMGGSLCHALRARANPPTVLGADLDMTQGARAREVGVVDHFSADPAGLVPDADVIVYATPLAVTMQLMQEHAGFWGAETLVTDVVSLKAPLLRTARAGGFQDRFVGAHPICGGEASGFSAARADLFEGATIWLCADAATGPDARARAEAFWRSIGGLPEWTDAERHDEEMAWVSHLPQLVANALSGALEAAGYRHADLGPGGRDMTRLAGSNPDLWRDLLHASAPVTGTGLTSVGNALNVIADLLARREIDRVVEFMERTRRWREDTA